VWRVELPDGPAVFKQLVDGPEAAGRYAREVTALRAAAAVEPPVAPRLLGTDPDDRVLVLEYLDSRKPGSDWIVGFAGALARLHAAGGSGTAVAGLPAWRGPFDGDVRAFLSLARALGVPVPPGAPAELSALIERLARAPAHALLHGDPCPDNELYTPVGVRFIDFEYASRGNGLVELAYLRIGFPTCWCVTAPEPELLNAAERAYRAAWRGATGTDVTGDLVDACAGWLLRADGLVGRALRGTADRWSQLLEQDWTWGTATARQRLLHRLLVVGQLTAESGPEGSAGALAETGRLAGDMAASVIGRWPGLRSLPSRRP
jgi:tRNA A-37 threonylcarbamoyl transferase component Bud32